MAPKEKGQLTPMEIRLLRWWIDNGASFDKPVGSVAAGYGDGGGFAGVSSGTAGPVAGVAVMNVADSDLLVGPPAPQAPAEAVQRLRAAGVLVLPIAQGSNYLEVDCVSDSLGPDAIESDSDVEGAASLAEVQLGSGRGRSGGGGRGLSAAGAAMVGSYSDHGSESRGPSNAGEPEISEPDGYGGGGGGCREAKGDAEIIGLVFVSNEGRQGGLGWITAGLSTGDAGFWRVCDAVSG